MSKIGIAICNACLEPTEVLNTEYIGIHSKCCDASIVHKNIKPLYRLYFTTTVTDTNKKKTWIGGEHTSRKHLESIGKAVVNGEKTKFRISMILEERI